MQIKFPTSVKKIDFTQPVIMCIPLSGSLTQPPDQSPCVIESCPSCGEKMWVSEKKRVARALHPEIETYCILCVFLSSKAQGIDIDTENLLDLGA